MNLVEEFKLEGENTLIKDAYKHDIVNPKQVSKVIYGLDYQDIQEYDECIKMLKEIDFNEDLAIQYLKDKKFDNIKVEYEGDKSERAYVFDCYLDNKNYKVFMNSSTCIISYKTNATNVSIDWLGYNFNVSDSYKDILYSIVHINALKDQNDKIINNKVKDKKETIQDIKEIDESISESKDKITKEIRDNDYYLDKYEWIKEHLINQKPTKEDLLIIKNHPYNYNLVEEFLDETYPFSDVIEIVPTSLDRKASIYCISDEDGNKNAYVYADNTNLIVYENQDNFIYKDFSIESMLYVAIKEDNQEFLNAINNVYRKEIIALLRNSLKFPALEKENIEDRILKEHFNKTNVDKRGL